MQFKDRVDAGQQLADALVDYRGEDILVYALSSGGAVLGYYIAKSLNAHLDLMIINTIGHPYNANYPVCAVAEDRHILCSQWETAYLDARWLHGHIKAQREEAGRRRQFYQHNRTENLLDHKTALIVDDGTTPALAFRLAVSELRHRNTNQVLVALPVASEDLALVIRQEVDELIILNVPFEFTGGAASYYDEFQPVSDEEVRSLLQQVS